jgi:hypothetical protein
MRKYLNIIILLLFLHMVNIIMLGCTANLELPNKIDPEEFIFIGEIIEYIGPVELIDGDKAWGLKVKVKEVVNMPEVGSQFYSIFSYETYSDCSTAGLKIDKVMEQYPLQSNVRVIAKKATQIKDSSNLGKPILEAWTFNNGQIISDFNDKELKTNSIQQYNYKSYDNKRYNYYRELESKDRLRNFNLNRLKLYSQEEIPYFELKKDLFRLGNSKNEKEKYKILKRLAYYPDNELDFNMLVKTNINSYLLIKQLQDERIKWINSEKKSTKIY